jgi:hypothetical protein
VCKRLSRKQSRFRRKKKARKVDASQALCMENALLSSRCKKRKRAHPNMVYVHHSLQERSSIDPLEVGIGGVVDSDPPPLFFLAGLRFRIFPLVGLELGGKKS